LYRCPELEVVRPTKSIQRRHPITGEGVKHVTSLKSTKLRLKYTGKQVKLMRLINKTNLN